MSVKSLPTAKYVATSKALQLLYKQQPQKSSVFRSFLIDFGNIAHRKLPTMKQQESVQTSKVIENLGLLKTITKFKTLERTAIIFVRLKKRDMGPEAKCTRQIKTRYHKRTKNIIFVQKRTTYIFVRLRKRDMGPEAEKEMYKAHKNQVSQTYKENYFCTKKELHIFLYA